MYAAHQIRDEQLQINSYSPPRAKANGQRGMQASRVDIRLINFIHLLHLYLLPVWHCPGHNQHTEQCSHLYHQVPHLHPQW